MGIGNKKDFLVEYNNNIIARAVVFKVWDVPMSFGELFLDLILMRNKGEATV